MDFDFNKKDSAQEPERAYPPQGAGAPQEAGHDGQPQQPINSGAQDGWNAVPQPPTDDATQGGWNAAPQPPANDTVQGGWNTAPQPPASGPAQDGWNSAEQRTPYQVPVREGQAPRVQAEQADGMPGAQNNFSTYEEWQRQNQKPKKKPKKAKKGSRIVLRVVGGVVAACFVFAGGIFAGSLFGAQDSAAPASSSIDGSAPADTPKLTISQAASSTGSASDEGLTGEEIYEKVSPSVVSIVASSLATQGQASGSGVIMTEEGLIITNAHVITDENTNLPADKVTVVTNDGQQHTAKIVGYDHQTDLAVLQITDGGTFTPAEFGDSSQIKAGEKAYAIGSPGGVQLANSITTGSISAISRDITIDDRVMTLIQTDASINPGNSGGALINKYGQVIGITSAKLGISYYEGLGFAIPIDSAKDVVDQIIAYGHVKGRPAIGVTGYNLSKQSAEYNGVPQGVVVTEVDERSDAAAKGLQPKDIIIGVNGKEITTMDEINEQKENSKAGDKMTLRVYRIETGKTFDIEITLADQADLSSSSAPAQQQRQIPQQGNGGYYFQLP